MEQLPVVPDVGAPFFRESTKCTKAGEPGSVTAEQLTPEQAKEASLAMAQELAAEGIVLLENRDNALPRWSR